MTFLQKSGLTNVVHVVKSFMLQLKNTWKETSGYIPTLTIALVDGNE